MEKPDDGKIIPFERGREKELEKLEKKVERIRKEAMEIYERILETEGVKEKALEEELKKPSSPANLELLAFLHEDLDLLRRSEDELLEIIRSSLEKTEEVEERLEKIRETIPEERLIFKICLKIY